MMMSDTKEKILLTALRMFARDGFEAVSVSAIAGELGMTKGALYKHYKSKRDIFDCIFDHVYREDVIRAKKHGVPEDVFANAPLAFKNTSMEQLIDYIKATFRIWLEDELARNFRKMLTIEQYRRPEMGDMYKLCVGQAGYIEDLFREMMEQGILNQGDPKLLALEFFAPYHFLLNMAMADVSSDIEEAANLLDAHIEHFMKANTANGKKENQDGEERNNDAGSIG
jgi:AcrR family transcriptional regulator